jgi:hypothetical protein
MAATSGPVSQGIVTDGSALDPLLGEISDGVGSGQAEPAAAMRRPGHVARQELDDVRAGHSRTASEEADSKSVTVNAYVLDYRLPGDEPPKGRPPSGRSPRQARTAMANAARY